MEAHLKGLKRIVDKKGGLDQLSSPYLRLKISWYVLLTSHECKTAGGSECVPVAARPGNWDITKIAR
jgi:hypothetical protein